MDLRLNGLVSAAFFLATIVIFSIMSIVSLLASLYRYKFGDHPRSIVGTSVFDHFLASAIILAIDIFVIAVFSSTHKVLSATEAASLDWWMLFVWGPAHIFVYVITVVILRRVHKNKRKDLSKSL